MRSDKLAARVFCKAFNPQMGKRRGCFNGSGFGLAGYRCELRKKLKINQTARHELKVPFALGRFFLADQRPHFPHFLGNLPRVAGQGEYGRISEPIFSAKSLSPATTRARDRAICSHVQASLR